LQKHVRDPHHMHVGKEVRVHLQQLNERKST